jgi:hypothetical protein
MPRFRLPLIRPAVYFAGLAVIGVSWTVLIASGASIPGGSAAGWLAIYATLAALAVLAAGRCLDAGWPGWITTVFVLTVGLVLFQFGNAETAQLMPLSGAALALIGLLPRRRAGGFTT